MSSSAVRSHVNAVGLRRGWRRRGARGRRHRAAGRHAASAVGAHVEAVDRGDVARQHLVEAAEAGRERRRAVDRGLERHEAEALDRRRVQHERGVAVQPALLVLGDRRQRDDVGSQFRDGGAGARPRRRATSPCGGLGPASTSCPDHPRRRSSNQTSIANGRFLCWYDVAHAQHVAGFDRLRGSAGRAIGRRVGLARCRTTRSTTGFPPRAGRRGGRPGASAR